MLRKAGRNSRGSDSLAVMLGLPTDMQANDNSGRELSMSFVGGGNFVDFRQKLGVASAPPLAGLAH